MKSTEFNPHTYIASFCDDDIDKIVDAIIDENRPDIIRCFLAKGVFLTLSEIRASKRRQAKMPAVVEESKKPKKPSKMIHLSHKTMEMAKTALHGVMLDWKIRGVSLGLVTKEMLCDEIERETKLRGGHDKNITLYVALNQKLKRNHDKVADVWTEEEVENLKRSIWITEDMD